MQIKIIQQWKCACNLVPSVSVSTSRVSAFSSVSLLHPSTQAPFGWCTAVWTNLRPLGLGHKSDTEISPCVLMLIAFLFCLTQATPWFPGCLSTSFSVAKCPKSPFQFLTQKVGHSFLVSSSSSGSTSTSNSQPPKYTNYSDDILSLQLLLIWTMLGEHIWCREEYGESCNYHVHGENPDAESVDDHSSKLPVIHLLLCLTVLFDLMSDEP